MINYQNPLRAFVPGAEEAAQAGLVSRLVPEDMVDAEVGISHLEHTMQLMWRDKNSILVWMEIYEQY